MTQGAPIAVGLLLLVAGCAEAPGGRPHDLQVSNILRHPVEVLVYIEDATNGAVIHDGPVAVATGIVGNATSPDGERSQILGWSTTEVRLQLPDGHYLVRASWNGTMAEEQIELGEGNYDVIVSTSWHGVAISVADFPRP